MRNFSDWREDPSKDKPLNENTDAAEMLRQKLNSSSDYLRQAFGGTPYADKFTSQPPQEKPTDLSDLAKSLDNTVSRIEEQLAAERAELDKQIHEEHIEPTTVNEEVESSDIYKLYRDREETFECNISVEGASLASAVARIIVDTNTLNLIFYGKLYKDGRCLVPLQKMTMYPEGTRGQIRLEVIVDDTVFSPWESSCVVEGAKKVTVDIKQKKQVSVNFGETNK
jgi:hypothetical protein